MLKKYQKEISYCTFCPKLCRFSCPVTNAEARETVTPTVKMTFLKLLGENAIDLTGDEADIFHRCLGCRLCRAYCKHRIDVGEIMIEARNRAFDKGVSPETIKSYAQKFEAHGNPYGPELEEKLSALKQERRINKTAKVIYFIGPVTLQHYPRLAKNMIEMLEICGADFAVFGGKTLSCGAPAMLAGDTKTFTSTAKKVSEILNSYETVITGDPGTLTVFKEQYPQLELELKPRLMHTTEFLAEQARNGRIDFGVRTDERVMYHDPCHMSKYLNILEPPRYLLEKMFFPDNILEFSWNKDKNYCCGGSGLVPVVAPETASAISKHRLEEFYEASPDMLITACPTCERTFEKADSNLKVKDIVSSVYEHLKK